MTIEKGKDWGRPVELPEGAPIVSTDRSLAELFAVADGGLSGPAFVGLNGGDLARTVGAEAPDEDIRRGERVGLPVDLAVARVDERSLVVASSLVIRRFGWLGTVQGAMNASFLGDWNVVPAGHPNDGRFDVVVSELAFGDWLKARRRLVLGTHVPHPKISIRRLKKYSFDVPLGAGVWIDGRAIGRATRVDLEVFPDSTTVVI